MASVLDPVDVQDFKMKQFCRFKVTDKTYDFQDTLSLLATSHIFGLVFVGTPDKVLVLKVADIVEIDNSTSKKTEVSTYPSKEIKLPSSPCFLGLSSDNLTLLVCLLQSGCPVGWLYDVRGFARQAGNWSPFQEVRLSSTDGTTVKDCAWNPTIPGLVAICLSDGSLVAVEINNTQFSISSLPASTGALAISWSPKGKQLVVAKSGKLVQYKPDLKEAKTILFSGADVHMSQPIVCGLQWLSTSQFLVTFTDESDPNSRPHLHIVNVHKSGANTYVDYDDVCYGNPSGERSNRYASLNVPSWNVLLICSANAMEVAVVGQSGSEGTDHPEWRQWTLEGECRAELPLDKNDETKPMGMAMDITSQTPIPWLENQTLPAMPILFVLSTHGLLCPFHVINLMSGASSVNQPPQQLSVINERPALSGIAMKAPLTVPLAASTPLPSGGKTAIPRTNLGERFAAFSATPSSIAPTLEKPLQANTESIQYFSQSQVLPQVNAPSTAPSKTLPISVPATAPARIAPVEVAAVSKSAVVAVQLTNQTSSSTSEESSMGAAAAILRDEVAKFVLDLQEFKARSSTLKVTVASEEDKQRLLKMTSELSDFGVDLVDTTKMQDEEVRGLCTDLVEVAALLEDARVRHARRKNSRYSHLLKLRPLDPANRRKLDGIERLHVHIEQQLVEAWRNLDSISRDRTKDRHRQIEIPITQVIYEAIRNNSKVISQLKSRVERIKAQSKEQQLKLAGAAFEALRPKAPEESRQWESELAVLADSLLSSRIRGDRDGEIQSTHPVIRQVSPEKQAMLRSVLSQRPVARIRAVRPESIAESRLLSNLTGLMHAEEKKDHSLTCTSIVSQAPSKNGVLAVQPVAQHSSPETKPQLPRGLALAGLANSESLGANASGNGSSSSPSRVPKQITTPIQSSLVSRQTVKVEDITPPSSPLNFDQKAKAIGNQPMMSSLSLPTRILTTTNTTGAETSPAISLTEVKPKVSASASASPPSYPTGSKTGLNILATTAASLSFGSSKSDSLIGFGSNSLFGKSSFASAFSTATSSASASASPSATTTTTSSKLITAVTESFASFGASMASSAASTRPQNHSVAPAPVPTLAAAPFFVTATPAGQSSLAPVSVNTSTVTKPIETVPSLKTSFSFTSLSSATTSDAPPTNSAPAPAPVPVPPVVSTPQTSVTPSSSNFSFASTTLPASTSVPTAVTAAPFSFVLPQSTTTTSTPAVSQSSTVQPTVTPANFSFSLPKGVTPASTLPSAAPFTLNLSGNTAIPTNAGGTLSVFGATTGSSTAGGRPVFSLNQSNKTPTAFGVVATTTTTAATTSTPSAPLFGQVATASTTATAVTSLFGQPASLQATTTSNNTGLTSLFGQSKLGDVVTAPTPSAQSTQTLTQGTTGTATVANTIAASSTTTGVAAPLFGRPVTTTGSTGTSLFGQPTNAITSPFGSAFGQTVFGQPVSTTITSTPNAASVFGQSTFGKPAPATPQSTVAPAPAFGSTPVFGQPSATPTGLLAGSVFGQGAASAATSTKPLFGGSAFGQTPTSNSTVAVAPATSPAPSTGFGSNLFGNMGLGGTPSVVNANRNAFGGGAVFGSGTPSASGTFASGTTSGASPFGSQPAVPAVSPPTFASPSSTGFGAFGQSQPAFGGAATFGGSPLFGNKPTFGGGATFGSPVAGIATATPKPETGFGAFAAASNVPTFGVLASSGPSFETLANSGNSQPAFGGAAFPSSNPPSFGGGSSFSSWR